MTTNDLGKESSIVAMEVLNTMVCGRMTNRIRLILMAIDNHTESIAIPNKSFNESKSFILNSCIHSLKRIVIGDECFGSVRVFELDGLSELESIVIGEWSFRISINERSDGSCRIANCPKLKSIQIGGGSFSDYHSFELNNLPSLQSIDIGDWCFFWAPSFSLTGLIDWLV